MNEQEIYEQNEYRANRNMAFSCLIIGAVLLILTVLVFADVKVFAFGQHTIQLVKIIFPIVAVLSFVPICLIKSSIFKMVGFKYFLITLLTLAFAVINIVLPKDGVLLWAIPLALAMLFFDKKVIVVTLIEVLALMLVTTPLGMLIGEWDSNLLAVSEQEFDVLIRFDNGEFLNHESFFDRLYYVNNFSKYKELLGLTVRDRWASCFLFYFLPRALMITVVGSLGVGLSKRAEIILDERICDTKHVQKMTSELSIATSIQAGVLPKEFPDSKYGEIYALSDPAKEVGGDLYDFFEIDEEHLALVIADASGKGVPASLYMMKTQSVLRALCRRTKSFDTGKLMIELNKSICEGNEMTMFVTCWLGIFNREDGTLTYTNAGHNPPIIKLGQKYEFLNSKPGIVLGAFSDFEYMTSTIKVGKGDKLFLYTDGVTEAHNVRSELYGEERLMNLVSKLDKSPYETIYRVREDVREFSRNAEQFDDITMLMLEYRKPQAVFTKSFAAVRENLDKVQDFIIKSIKGDLTPKDKNEIMICAEEIFINIASYAFENEGRCSIDVSFENNVLTLVFKDNGVPFDPLAKEDPNVKMKAQEREIGGLGIFMVKNLMDKVFYERKDNKNILVLVKRY